MRDVRSLGHILWSHLDLMITLKGLQKTQPLVFGLHRWTDLCVEKDKSPSGTFYLNLCSQNKPSTCDYASKLVTHYPTTQDS